MGRPNIHSQLATLRRKHHIFLQYNMNDKALILGWLHEPKQSAREIVANAVNPI